jgi:hypothetical protein
MHVSEPPAQPDDVPGEPDAAEPDAAERHAGIGYSGTVVPDPDSPHDVGYGGTGRHA